MAALGTVVVDVDLPQLVLRLVEESEYDNDFMYQTFTERVKVGDVVVFERQYSDDDSNAREHYAYNADEAREKALNELGEKLKNLLGE